MVFWMFYDVWCHLAHTSWNPLKSTPRPPELRAPLQQNERIKWQMSEYRSDRMRDKRSDKRLDKRSDKRSDRISSKMLVYALIEYQTIEWHIKYQSICQLLAITRSIFVGTWYFARTILFDDVFLVTYDKDVYIFLDPALITVTGSLLHNTVVCLVFRNACEEIPTEK